LRDLTQWFFKITSMSQELLDGLDTLDRWPDKVKLMQSNWIGRSEGLAFEFGLLRLRLCVEGNKKIVGAGIGNDLCMFHVGGDLEGKLAKMQEDLAAALGEIKTLREAAKVTVTVETDGDETPEVVQKSKAGKGRKSESEGAVPPAETAAEEPEKPAEA